MKKKKSQLIAVIDIGSHSIRLFIGQVIRRGIFKEIDHLWVPIPIGRDTFSKGVVSNQTIREVIKIIKNFQEVIKSYQIETIKAIATSSIREANNSDVLIERIYGSTGIKIEIIQPITETRILYNGVRSVMKDRYGFLTDNVLFFSIGGGCTQIVLQSQGKVVFSETHNQGTLRLLKTLELPEKYFEFTLDHIAYSFSNTLSHFSEISKIDRFVALNDDILNMIKSMHQEKEVQGVYRVPGKKLLRRLDEIRGLNSDEMSEKFSLNENVAGTTWLALMVIGRFFSLTGAKEVLFPDVSMSSALLEQLSLREEDLLYMDEDTEQNIIAAAHHLGQKYQYDEQHANDVARLALMIFDQMKPVYGFMPRERIYLHLAALLHDIGTFVGSGSHHKHSFRLISSTELLGLDNEEMQVIALITRYHRKAVPKLSHPEYISMPSEKRIMVSRLASILRLADALDNSHAQMVDGLKVNILDDKCEILVRMKRDKFEYLDVLKYSVKRKSDLFENFFGIPVVLERLL